MSVDKLIMKDDFLFKRNSDECKGDIIIHDQIYFWFFFFFRIQKELAEITIDPPPNCRLVVRSEISTVVLILKSRVRLVMTKYV